MKGAPNFRQWPDAVDGIWKQELLIWLSQVTGIRTLIETGTCEGSTPAAIHQHFSDIYTVELHDGLYETSRQRLASISNVHLYHDSSPSFLRNLLPIISPEVLLLFWLDAHTSGPHTADAGDVLPAEVAAIDELCPNPLVVIDDMIGLGQFIGQVSSVDLSNWSVEYRTGEIVMHKGGYSIPPFES